MPEPDLSHLVAALSGKMTDQSSRLNILQDAIRTPPRSPAEMLLQDRGRLYLSAMEIRQQEFEAARARLKQISTASPVAAEAGLLIAESWRLQGNHEESLNWFLRVGRHFPDDMNALHGLLSAAASLQQGGHSREAAALYGEVVEKSLDAVAKLEDLPDDPDALLDILFFRQHSMPPTLRRQITGEILAGMTDLSRTRQVYHEATREWRCLLEQQQRLELQGERLRQHSSRLTQASALVDASLTELDQETGLLEKELVSEDFSASQLTIRKRLGQARNEKIRLMAQRDFIERTRELLPQALNSTERKLQAMTETFSEIRQRASKDLYHEAQQAIGATMATLRNLAGDSQRQLAEIQMQQANRP